MSEQTGEPASPALAELERVAQERRERDGLRTQVDVVRQRLEQERAAASAAAERLGAEQRDVERLESMSMTRILAGLRGSRSSDLDRERAEAQAAEYAVAEARSRVAREEWDLGSLEERIAGFGDLDARHRDALAAREAEIAADPGAAATSERLTALAGEAGTVRGELTELGEATAAAREADARLDQAAQLLGRADGWATYDTFLGGGMLGDMAKHQNLDRAAVLMREADAALARLAAELADVGIGSVGEIGITSMSRALDVWFDNIFSDWAVKNRIGEAAARVAQLRSALAATGQELGRRTAAARGRLASLEAERERLLREGG